TPSTGATEQRSIATQIGPVPPGFAAVSTLRYGNRLMFQSIVRKIVGSKNDRDLKRLWPLVEEINKLEPGLEPLTNDALRAKTAEFRERLAKGEELEDLLPEAFAVVRETSRRVLGMRHFDVQLIGGM